ncbi:MAG: DUF6438 domain-containing protein [Saprospiraceae bacterium]
MKNLLYCLAATVLILSCSPYEYDATSFIELKKGPCFHFCPVYTFHADGRGNATYTGEENVSKEGQWQQTLSPEVTNALFKSYAEANFWDFEDEYTDHISDLPTVWLTFSYGGQKKTIKDYYGGPESLKALEKMAQDIAQSEDGWTKAEPQ